MILVSFAQLRAAETPDLRETHSGENRHARYLG